MTDTHYYQHRVLKCSVITFTKICVTCLKICLRNLYFICSKSIGLEIFITFFLRLRYLIDRKYSYFYIFLYYSKWINSNRNIVKIIYYRIGVKSVQNSNCVNPHFLFHTWHNVNSMRIIFFYISTLYTFT